MRTNSVSFGRVVTASGSQKKMNNIDKKINASKAVKIEDVTDYYRHALPSGQMAQAAQRGESIRLYLTGQERRNVEQKKEGWQTIPQILEHIQKYYNSNNYSISELVDIIIKGK